MSGSKPGAVLIAGPTASGKSARAAALAERLGGTVINADSMQVYADLRTLTARPASADESRVPHALYGFVDGAENFSVGRWLAAAADAIAVARSQGRVPVLVGGTGLYFKALTQGLSAIPPVPDAVRQQVRAKAESQDAAALHARLQACDPAMAARLRPSDRQRLLRALEVWAATGTSLAAFQSRRAPPLLAPGTWTGVFLAPERTVLQTAIDRRFKAMMAQGALDEVRALGARQLDPALPVMRAHGVPPLLGFLAGAVSLKESIAAGQRDTRAYMKRQFTFARHQLPEFRWIAPDQALDIG